MNYKNFGGKDTAFLQEKAKNLHSLFAFVQNLF